MRTQWNEAEDAALMGLPYLAQLVYLRAIRPYMDFATGIAGRRRGISYQGLGEALYVEPGPGRERHGAPSRSALRHALGLLERAGLIERQAADRQLIFFLPLAARDESVSERYDRFTTDPKPERYDIEDAFENNVLNDRRDRFTTDPKTERYDTPPVSGKREERGANAPVEFARANVDGDAHPLLPVRHVFDYWRRRSEHPRAKLDAKRAKAIAARLKDGYSVEDLKTAIDGCLASPWHQGQNERRRKFDDIELICRNASKVDQFVALAGSESTEQQKLEDWLHEDQVIEGECRRVR